MNIDMRNIPDDFERNIKEIMDFRKIPATKALVWALEDRKMKEKQIELLKKEINNQRHKIAELEKYKDCLESLKKTLKSI